MNCATADQAPKIIIVAGPTASGKTGFAIDLARRFGGEIIGADSMQIYRHMDIGTAKPTAAEQAAVPHHLIDVVDPDVDFDAAAYAAMASGVIRQVVARGRTAFVVGGTGFYIKALMYGLFEEGPADPAVRQRLTAEANADGGASLYRQLADIDPSAARRIHPNDTYRIVRAMEIYAVSGQPPSVVQQRHGFRAPQFQALEIGLSWPRSILYERINRRVDVMMNQGFLDEVQWLLKNGYARTLKSMQSLGYRHLAAVIEGDVRLADAIEALKRDHRRYAKRQLTWFGAHRGMHWLAPDQRQGAHVLIHAFLGAATGGLTAG